MFSKDKTNLRRRTSLIYLLLTVVVVLGLFFMILSGYIMEEDIPVMASPINEKITLSSYENINIIKWVYDENENKMEVIIDTSNLGSEYEKISFESFQRSDGKELDTKVIFEEDQVYMVHINNISKEYIQIALEMIVNVPTENEGKFTSKVFKTLYNDYRKVDKEKVEMHDEITNFAYLNNYMIDSFENEIKDIYTEREKITDEIKQIKSNIKELESSRSYQTEDEKVETNSLISSQEMSIDSKEKDIERLKLREKLLKEKIGKREQRIREKQINYTDNF